MSTVFIYGLFDPRTLELRYIGKADNVEQRLGNHIRDAKALRDYNPHKSRWIRQLLSESLTPAIEVLEECAEDTWQKIEDEWIQEARAKGANLTNIMNGGQGGSFKGRKLSERAKQRISSGLKGRPSPNKGRKAKPETIHKLSERNKGINNPMYGLKGENHPAFGYIYTEEQRKRRSEQAKGRVSPNRGISPSEETKEKIRIANTGKVFSEEHRRRISESKKGKPNSNTGRKLSEETKKKISEARKRYYQNPENRRKNSEMVRERLGKKLSRDNKDLWNDPERRKERIEAMRKGWQKKKLRESLTDG